MPRRALCAGGCGRVLYISNTSLPPGEATCQQCRAVVRKIPCPVCRAVFRPVRARRKGEWTKTCSRSCGQLFSSYRRERGIGRDPGDYRVRRYLRDGAAPGISRAAREALAVKWRRQGRLCAYCGERPGDTVDHVIPLIRGGTNFEGNLVPACRPCNGSKGPWLVSEWRTGRRPEWLRVAYIPRAVPTHPPRVPVWSQLGLSFCELPGCDGLTVDRFCDGECQLEFNARSVRDLYRSRHGLPVDPLRPTKPFGRRLARAGESWTGAAAAT